MKKTTSKILSTCFLAFTLILSSCNKASKYTISVIYGKGGGVFEAGSVATITADTAPQYQHFDYWECEGRSVSTNNPYTFTVNKTATYTAIYKTEQATVTVINGTGGGTYDMGSTVTITANAPEFQTFKHWEVDGEVVSTSNPYTFTVTEDITYSAIFENQTAELIVKNGAGSGTYDLGSSVTVTATPSKSESFKHWEVDGEVVSTSNPYTFTFLKATTIEAVFSRGILKTDTTPIDVTSIDVDNGGTITIDYKFNDSQIDKSKSVSLLFGSDINNCFGEYVLYFDHLEKSYNGVSFTSLDDGYQRITVCAGQLDNVVPGSFSPSTITKILFNNFTVTKGVFFDIKSTPVSESSSPRGIYNKSGNYNPLSLSKTITVSDGGTITLDYKYVDPIVDVDNGVSLYFGSDDTHRFGNYKIFHNQLGDNPSTTYSGITFTTLDDGYHRLTVCVKQLNKVYSGENAPTIISKILFRWFEVTEGIYFDINPDDRFSKTTEFTMKGSRFVIANFTDLHVDNESLLKDSGTVGKTIKYGIENSAPDILVFSGDLAGKAADLGYIFSYIDSFEIPYFVILGNHDHEGSLGYNTIESYINQSQYGYISKGPEEFENHLGNYTVKIKNSQDKLVHSLILMSTGNKYTISDYSSVEYVSGTKVSGVKYGTFNSQTTYCDGTSGAGNAWDGIRGEQIDWYEQTATDLGCETTLICHAGFNEYVKAYEQYQDAVNKKDQAAIDACKPIGQCNMGEQCCGTVENTGLFSKIKSCGTKNVICGHDHLNDFSLLYQGVRLTYALKTGSGAYWKDDGSRNGYTELTIDSKGSTSLNQIYFNPLP